MENERFGGFWIFSKKSLKIDRKKSRFFSSSLSRSRTRTRWLLAMAKSIHRQRLSTCRRDKVNQQIMQWMKNALQRSKVINNVEKTCFMIRVLENEFASLQIVSLICRRNDENSKMHFNTFPCFFPTSRMLNVCWFWWRANFKWQWEFHFHEKSIRCGNFLILHFLFFENIRIFKLTVSHPLAHKRRHTRLCLKSSPTWKMIYELQKCGADNDDMIMIIVKSFQVNNSILHAIVNKFQVSLSFLRRLGTFFHWSCIDEQPPVLKWMQWEFLEFSQFREFLFISFGFSSLQFLIFPARMDKTSKDFPGKNL